MKNERAQIDQKYEGEKRGADEEIWEKENKILE